MFYVWAERQSRETKHVCSSPEYTGISCPFQQGLLPKPLQSPLEENEWNNVTTGRKTTWWGWGKDCGLSVKKDFVKVTEPFSYNLVKGKIVVVVNSPTKCGLYNNVTTHINISQLHTVYTCSIWKVRSFLLWFGVLSIKLNQLNVYKWLFFFQFYFKIWLYR